MAPLLNFTRRPFQPTIASFEMIGWRSENAQSHPLYPAFDNVTGDPATYGRVLEVMFLSQKLVEPKQVSLRRQANRQVGQKPRFFWQSNYPLIQYMHAHARNSIRNGGSAPANSH